MARTAWLGAVIVSGVAVVCLVGCGPGNPQGRVAISGTVTFEGQPLDQGSIEFTALEADSGIRSGAVIQNGSFSIETQKGLPPGKYRVRIYSAAADPMAEVPEMPGESEGAPQERIPPEWNTKSSQEITVTDGGRNEYEFNIQ